MTQGAAGRRCRRRRRCRRKIFDLLASLAMREGRKHPLIKENNVSRPPVIIL